MRKVISGSFTFLFNFWVSFCKRTIFLWIFSIIFSRSSRSSLLTSTILPHKTVLSTFSMASVSQLFKVIFTAQGSVARCCLDMDMYICVYVCVSHLQELIKHGLLCIFKSAVLLPVPFLHSMKSACVQSADRPWLLLALLIWWPPLWVSQFPMSKVHNKRWV